MIGDLFDEDAGNGQVFRKRLDLDPTDAWRKVTAHCVDAGYDLAVSLVSPGISREAKGAMALERPPGSCSIDSDRCEGPASAGIKC